MKGQQTDPLPYSIMMLLWCWVQLYASLHRCAGLAAVCLSLAGKAWTTTMQLQDANNAGGPAAAAAEAEQRGDEQPLTT